MTLLKSAKLNLPVGEEPTADVDIFSLLGEEEAYDWQKHEEGQLSVDVAETEEEIIILATMGGTSPDKVELHLHNDLLSIRGERLPPVSGTADWHCAENYWGHFSRTIVLPKEVKPELCRAEYKNGLLTVRLSKVQVDKNIPIFVIDE